MTETNHAQTIPVSPSVFPTKNKKMTKLNVDKIKTIEDVKNVFELLDLGFYLPEDHKNYKLFKELTIQPEEPKGIEYYQKELDKKFEEIIEQTTRNSYASKQIAERNYEKKFDMISYNFEYAVKNGFFPVKHLFGIDYSNVSLNNAITYNFVFKPAAIGVGYWEIDPNIQVYRKTKPNRIVRYFSRLLLDFHWKDV